MNEPLLNELPIDVSVDDKRALWALTTRHLRSAAHPAVLLVRHALRRGARAIEVQTRGDRLIVSDDGIDLKDELAELTMLLSCPDAGALHDLEGQRGTDLLVAVVTAEAASCVGRSGRRLTMVGGEPGAVFDVDVQSAATAHGANRNVIRLRRPRSLRDAERRELLAWMPATRAEVVVDGRRLHRRSNNNGSMLPATTILPRDVVLESGRLQLGFALDDTVTRVTVLARGTWVAQEHLRIRGLPIVAVWNDDRLPARPFDVVPHARDVVAMATDELLSSLAASFTGLSLAHRRRLRALLVRGEQLPAAFTDVALFDDEDGAFRQSFNQLRQARRLVIGADHGDVVVDDDVSTFLHRTLPTSVVDALPPPRRRLRLVLRRWLS